jgi:uncharacterized protein YgbK (DUF1537 family)
MNEQTLPRCRLLKSLPAPREEDPSGDIESLIAQVGRKVIVLDDDPTGTQTVHDIPVITRWSVDHLVRELQDAAPAVYLLTNSRSLDSAGAVTRNREIAVALREASRRTGRDFVVISRSDSTLRGHFPAEVETLAGELGQSFDAWVLCPFFEEGGRLTINDVHYVAEGDQLVPAAQTPFARDAAFGFQHSHLHQWVVEKSDGQIPLDRIQSLSIEELRQSDPGDLTCKTKALEPGSVCVVNAATRQDLLVATHALLQAEAAGRKFLYRTAASFVAARAGIQPRSLLDAAELTAGQGRGVLLVVGSYVPRTTTQLEHLFERPDMLALELPAEVLLDDTRRERIIADAARLAAGKLAKDGSVVVYTSRELVGQADGAGLVAGRRISQALVAVVRAIDVRPRVVVAKGGITSSDLATQGYGVQRAVVLGQILPGVPVWRCGAESRFPDMPLVVFPGNVGDADALANLLDGFGC